MREALVQNVRLAAVQPEGAVGQPGQEGAVVADHQQSAAEPGQFAFQPGDSRQVQVVGRLVEQQEIWRRDQSARQGGPASFAAGQRPQLRGAVQGEPLEGRFGQRTSGRIVLRQAVGHIVGQSLFGRQAGRLRQVADLQTALQTATAAIQLDQSGQHLQPGRLSAAVASDQGGTLSPGQSQVEAFEQRPSPEAEAGILQGDQRGGGGHRRQK